MRRIPICEHIKTNGIRCGSPALRGEPFCYYHSEARRARFGGIFIPPLEDPEAIQLVLTDLARALIDRAILPKDATILAYILQTAVANSKRLRIDEPDDRDDIIRDLTPAVAAEDMPAPPLLNRKPALGPRKSAPPAPPAPPRPSIRPPGYPTKDTVTRVIPGDWPPPELIPPELADPALPTDDPQPPAPPKTHPC